MLKNLKIINVDTSVKWFQRLLCSLNQGFSWLRAPPVALHDERLTEAHPGWGELSLKLQEQHTLVHSLQGAQGLRRSCDTQVDL